MSRFMTVRDIASPRKAYTGCIALKGVGRLSGLSDTSRWIADTPNEVGPVQFEAASERLERDDLRAAARGDGAARATSARRDGPVHRRWNRRAPRRSLWRQVACTPRLA